jgi:hypothetical protein
LRISLTRDNMDIFQMDLLHLQQYYFVVMMHCLNYSRSEAAHWMMMQRRLMVFPLTDQVASNL